MDDFKKTIKNIMAETAQLKNTITNQEIVDTTDTRLLTSTGYVRRETMKKIKANATIVDTASWLAEYLTELEAMINDRIMCECEEFNITVDEIDPYMIEAYEAVDIALTSVDNLEMSFAFDIDYTDYVETVVCDVEFALDKISYIERRMHI